jgi:5-methyltetrahydrofolate--homocysteine methyltransferase
MVSERMEGTVSAPNRTADQTYQTVKSMVASMNEAGHAIPVHDCIVDTGIAPIGSDTEGGLKRVLDSLKLIHDDPQLQGIHASVGLSNFTVMLPPKRPDGMSVKSALESAFLTMAMPLGLDMVVGSVARKYERLAPDHPAMQCLSDVLKLEGYDSLTRVIEFYS